MSNLLAHGADLLVNVKKERTIRVFHDEIMLVDQALAVALLNYAILAVFVEFHNGRVIQRFKNLSLLSQSLFRILLL